MRVAGEEEPTSKRLDRLQARGRGTGTVGSLSWCRMELLSFGSKCPEEGGGGVPLRNSTSDQDEEGPCRLVPLCLQLHVPSLLWAAEDSRGPPAFQLAAKHCVWASNNFSATFR